MINISVDLTVISHDEGAGEIRVPCIVPVPLPLLPTIPIQKSFVEPPSKFMSPPPPPGKQLQATTPRTLLSPQARSSPVMTRELLSPVRIDGFSNVSVQSSFKSGVSTYHIPVNDGNRSSFLHCSSSGVGLQRPALATMLELQRCDLFQHQTSIRSDLQLFRCNGRLVFDGTWGLPEYAQSTLRTEIAEKSNTLLADALGLTVQVSAALARHQLCQNRSAPQRSDMSPKRPTSAFTHGNSALDSSTDSFLFDATNPALTVSARRPIDATLHLYRSHASSSTVRWPWQLEPVPIRPCPPLAPSIHHRSNISEVVPDPRKTPPTVREPLVEPQHNPDKDSECVVNLDNVAPEVITPKASLTPERSNSREIENLSRDKEKSIVSSRESPRAVSPGSVTGDQQLAVSPSPVHDKESAPVVELKSATPAALTPKTSLTPERPDSKGHERIPDDKDKSTPSCQSPNVSAVPSRSSSSKVSPEKPAELHETSPEEKVAEEHHPDEKVKVDSPEKTEKQKCEDEEEQRVSPEITQQQSVLGRVQLNLFEDDDEAELSLREEKSVEVNPSPQLVSVSPETRDPSPAAASKSPRRRNNRDQSVLPQPVTWAADLRSALQDIEDEKAELSETVAKNIPLEGPALLPADGLGAIDFYWKRRAVVLPRWCAPPPELDRFDQGRSVPSAAERQMPRVHNPTRRRLLLPPSLEDGDLFVSHGHSSANR